jgi:hypothetical protein
MNAWARPAACGLVALLLMGADCGRQPGADRRLGATEGDSGPAIFYVECPDERLVEIQVFASDGTDATGELLWGIRRQDSSARKEVFPLGEEARGWTTTHALATPLTGDVVVRSINEAGVRSSFVLAPGSLEMGQVFDGASNQPVDQFRNQALETCSD